MLGLLVLFFKLLGSRTGASHTGSIVERVDVILLVESCAEWHFQRCQVGDGELQYLRASGSRYE